MLAFFSLLNTVWVCVYNKNSVRLPLSSYNFWLSLIIMVLFLPNRLLVVFWKRTWWERNIISKSQASSVALSRIVSLKKFLGRSHTKLFRDSSHGAKQTPAQAEDCSSDSVEFVSVPHLPLLLKRLRVCAIIARNSATLVAWSLQKAVI